MVEKRGFVCVFILFLEWLRPETKWSLKREEVFSIRKSIELLRWLSVKESACNVGDTGDAGSKEMATHSSILAWENPWTEESGGL